MSFLEFYVPRLSKAFEGKGETMAIHLVQSSAVRKRQIPWPFLLIVRRWPRWARFTSTGKWIDTASIEFPSKYTVGRKAFPKLPISEMYESTHQGIWRSKNLRKLFSNIQPQKLTDDQPQTLHSCKVSSSQPPFSSWLDFVLSSKTSRPSSFTTNPPSSNSLQNSLK